MRDKRSFLVLTALALSLGGCASTTTSSTKREPLEVPPVPPRVIAPAPETSEGTQPEPVPALPRASRPAPRETAPKTEAKPAVEPQTQPPPETPASPAPPAPSPAAAPGTPGTPELKTAGTPDDAKASRDVRDTLDRAGRFLNSIDYRALSNPSKLQYDMAKRFIEQSEEALKARNYVAAKLMAEKAETIGKELGGR